LYDKSSKKFLWYHGKELPSWAPWGPGFPPKKKNLHPSLRVAIESAGRHSGSWEVWPKSKPLRYICELQVDPISGTTTRYPTTEPVTSGESTRPTTKDPVTSGESTTDSGGGKTPPPGGGGERCKGS
jgi:hypothetical protein